jgi:hypothetical protein
MVIAGGTGGTVLLGEIKLPLLYPRFPHSILFLFHPKRFPLFPLKETNVRAPDYHGRMTLIGVFNVHNENPFVFPTNSHSARTPRAVSQYTRVQVSRNRSFDGRLRALSGLCMIREFCTSHCPLQREVLRTGVAMPGIGRRHRPEAIERGPLRFRTRTPHIDVNFGDFQAPGLGIGAEGVEPDFGALIGGRNTGVDGDSGPRGSTLVAAYFSLLAK